MLYFVFMNTFFKYSGIFIQLIGVLLMAVSYFGKFQSNTTLIISWILVVFGFIVFILVNKRVS